ncbi:MAG: NADH pyrophosphatase zinc ribbon domain-containing protein, partial [Pseudomonadota bacterium]
MPLIFPDHDASANTGFGGNALERLSERREDTAFITTQADDPGARALLFVGDQLLTEGASAVHPRATAERHGLSLADSVFLGRDADGPLFAGLIERPADAAPSADGPPGGSGPAPTLDAGAGLATHPLRPLASHGLLAEPLLGAVAQARGVLGWHQRHQFCANCGTKTHSAMAGMRRDCPNCGAHHFPRTDPVVIMLAVDGERCLLGRQKRFVSGV